MPQFLHFVLALTILTQAPSLDSSSPKERREAIESMTVLGNREAVPVLVEALGKEPRSDIRASILASLGRIRDRSAIPGISEALLYDFEKEVRLQAIDSLLRLYVPVVDGEGFWTFFDKVKDVFSEEDRLLVGINEYVDQTAKEVLAQSLRQDFLPEVRIAAAYGLGSLRAADQVPALIEELEGPRNRDSRAWYRKWTGTAVRIAIIQTLGQIGSDDAGPALTRTLTDEDEGVVQEAVSALGVTGYGAAFPALSNLFKTSRNDDIREESLQSMAMMREPGAVALFEGLLDDSDDSYRELAAEGLARLDYDASGFGSMMESEKNANVRLALAFALVSSGRLQYMEDLVVALDTRRDYQAEVYLFELGKYDGKLGEMYPYLRNPNAKIRTKLLRVLGEVGEAEARPYIQPLTEDPNMDVMQEAVSALRKLTPSQ
jgi:HEAT repeat protein